MIVKNTHLTGELLLCCSRTKLDSTAIERINFLVQQQNIDWDFLLQMADKHRVMPLLYHSLKLACPNSVNPAILQTLRRRFHENSRTNLVLTHELLRLLSLFQEQEISVIAYKGTVLAASVYGKIGFRQIWDIDLLVKKGELQNSQTLLLSEGYRLKEDFDREQSFIHPSTNIEVDLHWGLTPFYFPINLDFEGLWQRTQLFTLFDTSIKSFCAEDLLLILCLQIAKDCWERRQHLEHLAKVCDIAELLGAYPDLNWSQVVTQASQQGSLRILHFGLFLAKSLLDAEVPNNIWSSVVEDSLAISLAAQVCRELFAEIDTAFASLHNPLFDFSLRIKQLIFYLKMRERPEHWWQHFIEIGRTIINPFKVSLISQKSQLSK